MKLAALLLLGSPVAIVSAYASVPTTATVDSAVVANTATQQKDMSEIARVASIMIDGDVCQHIVTQRALAHMLHPDPRDEWQAGDNYDVHDGPFIQTKKTLIRLAMMAPYPVDVNLWMPVPTTQDVQVVIRNKYNLSQFWNGELKQKMPPEMHEVLQSGKTLTIQKTSGMISVLAPVRNSLNQIVGLVEVVGSAVPPPHDEQ
ncbi:MAG: hypothetical protein ACYCOR_03785 [Acidobacteriaceae bacterium]